MEYFEADYKVYCDGAANNNKMGIGFIIFDKYGNEVLRKSLVYTTGNSRNQYLQTNLSFEAEYYSVINALRFLKNFLQEPSKVLILTDFIDIPKKLEKGTNDTIEIEKIRVLLDELTTEAGHNIVIKWISRKYNVAHAPAHLPFKLDQKKKKEVSQCSIR
jgi:ribonuclease HI